MIKYQNKNQLIQIGYLHQLIFVHFLILLNRIKKLNILSIFLNELFLRMSDILLQRPDNTASSLDELFLPKAGFNCLPTTLAI